MEPPSAPDSWDTDETSQTSSTNVSESLHKLSLNANAPVFTPGKNVNAAAFVPHTKQIFECAQPTDIAKTDTEMFPSELSQPCSASADMDMTTNEPSGDDNWVEEGRADKKPETAHFEGCSSALAENLSEDMEDDMEDESKDELQALQISKVKRRPADANMAQRKEHFNIVFIGHVDAGKSTIGGRILQVTGMVDQRTLEKYEREAKEKNRESWYLSWALDTNAEERDKGKTVEVGRAYFETDKRHFTILDAPGHKSFVPNMIGGASQADIAVLVISARKGEFETGFERGGQTREHAMLVKTAGVKHLVILINKMDDVTVDWDEARFNECRDKLLPYLKKLGWNPKADLKFIPCSGLTGAFIKESVVDPVKVPWYSGPTFLDYLESLPPVNRASEGPVRIPIVDRYKDMGTIALGKIESGQISMGMKLILMPNRREIEVMGIWSDEVETDAANSGENVRVKLKNAEEEDIQPGFVICSPNSVCRTGRVFDAQIVILEVKSIICAGYSAIMHIHTCAEEITIKALIALIDKKSGEKIPRPRFIKQDQVAIVRLELNAGIICLETFKDFPQMGRFTLRDEGRTIAIGKVLKVIE